MVNGLDFVIYKQPVLILYHQKLAHNPLIQSIQNGRWRRMNFLGWCFSCTWICLFYLERAREIKLDLKETP